MRTILSFVKLGNVLKCVLTNTVLILLLFPVKSDASVEVINELIGLSIGYQCVGYAALVQVDADNNGADETQVVFYTITGEAVPDSFGYFFSFIDSHCGGVYPYADKGRLKIRFVDMLATGFVWNNPSTWTFKSMEYAQVKTSHDLCTLSSSPYLGVYAYRGINQTNLIDYSTNGTLTVTDSTGIKEIYVSTDYCENLIEELTIDEGTGDGSKRDEIIGTWQDGTYYLYWDGSSWRRVRLGEKPDAENPSGDIEAGETNGDGVADVASSWSDGLKVQNGSTRGWEVLWSYPPDRVTMANVTGDARKEVIGAWRGTGSGAGVWYFYRTSTGWAYQKITDYPPEGDITAGDINGDGWDEVVSGYSTGTWIWYPRTNGWQRIAEPQYIIYNLACGDRDGDGRAEVIGGYNTGIWLWDGYWKKRLTDPGYVTQGDMEMGDFDKNGRDDLAVSFSDPPGLYINYDNGSWYKVYNIPPYRVTAGDLIDN